MVLFAVVMSMGVLTVVSSLLSQRLVSNGSGRTVILHNLILRSAIETFSAVLRFSEARYMIQTRECPEGTMFFKALVAGHGCDALGGAIQVFTKDDLEGLPLAQQDGIEFPSPFQIEKDTGTFGKDGWVMRIRLPILNSNRFVADFYLKAVVTEQNLASFEIQIMREPLPSDDDKDKTPPVELAISRRFTARISDLPYQLMIRMSDAAVITSTNLPHDTCASVVTASGQTGNQIGYVYLDPKLACRPTESMGGGMGLAYYRDMIFALHKGLGHIVGLTSKAMVQGRIVDEDGTINGIKVFPPVSRDALVNVSDFEVNAMDQGRDEVMAVSGGGSEVEFSYIDAADKTRRTVCNLGAIGMNVQATGLTSLSGNQSLTSDLKHFSAGVSSFFLKGLGGQVYYLSVKAVVDTPTGISAKYVVKDEKLGRYFVCALKHMPALENDLMKITWGTTRLHATNGFYTLD